MSKNKLRRIQTTQTPAPEPDSLQPTEKENTSTDLVNEDNQPEKISAEKDPGDSRQGKSLTHRFQSFCQKLPSDRYVKLSGIFCLVCATLLFLAILTHFFFWWADYDVVQQMQNGSIWSNNDWKVRNAGGRLGAYIAFTFVNTGFGLASFIFPVILAMIGLQILKIKRFNWFKIFFNASFLLLWTSILLGSIFKSGTSYILGGSVGINTADYLKGLTGIVGLSALLAFTLLAYLMLNYKLQNFHLPKLSIPGTRLSSLLGYRRDRMEKEKESPDFPQTAANTPEKPADKNTGNLHNPPIDQPDEDNDFGITLTSRIGLDLAKEDKTTHEPISAPMEATEDRQISSTIGNEFIPVRKEMGSLDENEPGIHLPPPQPYTPVSVPLSHAGTLSSDEPGQTPDTHPQNINPKEEVQQQPLEQERITLSINDTEGFHALTKLANMPESSNVPETNPQNLISPENHQENDASMPEKQAIANMEVIDTRTIQETQTSSNSVRHADHIGLDTPFNPRLELSDYRFPGIDLLEDFGDQSQKLEDMKAELSANKARIEETLQNYGISIDKISATIGPTVTLYEIVPAAGIRISKIKNLEDDIALSLSALGIRIIAPIPGRGTIGIEVPNSKKQIVPMRDMLTSDKFRNNDMALPVALGKTISNEVFVTDLAKMPHLLVAGATGQGKSVGLNAIIGSLLYSKHPAELKFVMVDPKKVELSLFNKIERHYLAKLPDSEEAIITDTRKVVRTLNSLCIEMDARYDLLKDAGAKNLKEYNKKFIERRLNPEEGHRFMPYIVLIIDEFADLIMTAGKEVETPIARLAQLARAIGIHLVIATQRPSVNIITGIIKANFPARIAFKVSQKIDSRTILDASGADQLIGRGDMLIQLGDGLTRLQCAYIDTPEIERITEFIGSQRAFPTAYMLPECPDENGSEGGKVDIDTDEWDSMFKDAAELVVSTQQGSTSMLQRKFKLGYNRAGRIMDQLESAGIVGPFDGKKTREVKIKDPQALEVIYRTLNI